MNTFRSLAHKETLNILRDPRTILIIIFMPVLLLLLFGFAISTEVNNVRIAAVVTAPDALTRKAIQRLDANSYITFCGIADADDVEHLLRSGELDAVVRLRSDGGCLSSQIEVDASNPTIAQASTAYVQSIIEGNTAAPVLTYTLYNPQMRSSYNFVPGIMGMIFILICAIMTSVSIVSEKESGTMSLLLVSPVRSSAIIFGKLIPYFALCCVLLAIMLTLTYTVLGLPLSASVVWVVAITVLYVVLSLSIGLMVSTLVNNQLGALILSAVVFMMPVVLLSGMIFPIDNMPVALQWVSCIIPARWYTEAMRKLMIQQLSVAYVWREIVIMLSMTVAILTFAVWKFNSQNKPVQK